MREMQHERRGAETEEQREDRLQQISLHSTAAQSVQHAFPNAPPRLNTYLWLPTLLSQARPTNVLHFTSYNTVLLHNDGLKQCLLARLSYVQFYQIYWHIFISCWAIISTHPQLNILSGGLIECLDEPRHVGVSTAGSF